METFRGSDISMLFYIGISCLLPSTVLLYRLLQMFSCIFNTILKLVIRDHIRVGQRISTAQLKKIYSGDKSESWL